MTFLWDYLNRHRLRVPCVFLVHNQNGTLKYASCRIYIKARRSWHQVEKTIIDSGNTRSKLCTMFKVLHACTCIAWILHTVLIQTLLLIFVFPDTEWYSGSLLHPTWSRPPLHRSRWSTFSVGNPESPANWTGHPRWKFFFRGAGHSTWNPGSYMLGILECVLKNVFKIMKRWSFVARNELFMICVIYIK